MRKILSLAAGLAVASTLLLASPSQAIAPISDNNCVAAAGNSCTFKPSTATPGAEGFISTTGGSFTITAPAGCSLTKPPLGSGPSVPASPTLGGDNITTDGSGRTVYSTGGQGARSLEFNRSGLCTYTLEVRGDGQGAVTAGQTN